MILRSNRITGPIPPELGQIPNLVFLDVRETELCGVIPDGLFYALFPEPDEINLAPCDPIASATPTLGSNPHPRIQLPQPRPWSRQLRRPLPDPVRYQFLPSLQHQNPRPTVSPTPEPTPTPAPTITTLPTPSDTAPTDAGTHVHSPALRPRLLLLQHYRLNQRT